MNATAEIGTNMSHGTATVGREFLTSGNATFTVEIPDSYREYHNVPAHYTFNIRRKIEDGAKTPMFISMLAGPNNESDYVYIGICTEPNGQVRLTKKSKLTADSYPVKILARVLARVFAGEQWAIEKAGFSVHHCGQCGRCGRALTTPESIQRGIGPECYRLMQEGR